MRPLTPFTIAAWIIVFLLGFGPQLKLPTIKLPWPITVIAPEQPTLIVMLHEAKHGLFPSYVVGAARELEAAGFEVRMVDDDVTDGSGETPEWLKPALEKGRALMGGASDDVQKDDALLLLSGEKVVKAIKMPATRLEIVEACK